MVLAKNKTSLLLLLRTRVKKADTAVPPHCFSGLTKPFGVYPPKPSSYLRPSSSYTTTWVHGFLLLKVKPTDACHRRSPTIYTCAAPSARPLPNKTFPARKKANPPQTNQTKSKTKICDKKVNNLDTFLLFCQKSKTKNKTNKKTTKTTKKSKTTKDKK